MALAAGAALLLSAGCGSSDDPPEGEPLPPDAVAALEKRLDEVQRRYDDGTGNGNAGACQDIEKDSYKAIDATVEGLPEDVDPDVREALEASLARLQELTREGCSDVKDTPAETDTAPQQPVIPPSVPEQTVPQETVPEETVPEKEKPNKDKEKDKDKGNGNGGQPGGTEVPGSDGGGGQPAPPAPEG